VQAALDRAPDVAAGGARLLRRAAHVHAELGGHHHLVAVPAERLAEQGLRAAAVAVDVGGVEQGDAGVQGRPDHRPGLGRVADQAEVVTPEADDGDGEAGPAELAVPHGGVPFCARLLGRAVGCA
jgi:hypothetical protein